MTGCSPQEIENCIRVIYQGKIFKDGKLNPVIKSDYLELIEALQIPKPDEKASNDDLKKIIIKKMNNCNFYKNFTRENFLNIYFLNSNLKKCKNNADVKAYNGLKKFFELNDETFKSTTEEISNSLSDEEKRNNTLTKTSETEQTDKILTLQNLINNPELYYLDVLRQINNKLQPENQFTMDEEGSCNRKPYSILIIYMLHLIALKGTIVTTGLNSIQNLTSFNLTDMEDIFTNKTPSSLDARQFIAVNKFTKYRKEEDKACFLFHGVGTGKTITSTTIALSHLSEENKFLKNAPGDENKDKKSLTILACCPQGLFFSSFQDDSGVLGMYSYDKTTSSVVGAEYTDSDGTKKNYTYIFESFEACMKCNEDDNSYYKISFTGFNYLELFKMDGLMQITEEYDVLICDEAHKIVTDKLQPESKIGYDIRYQDRLHPEKTGDIYEVPNIKNNPDLTKFETVTAIRDIRFVNFITSKIKKQSIFLTGTPIQKTPYDVVSILKFLNIKEINASNNAKLCEDVSRIAPSNPAYYFSKLDPKSDPLDNSGFFGKGGAATLFLILQNQSGALVNDLDATLNKDKSWRFSDYIGLVGEKIFGKEQLTKIQDEGKEVYKKVSLILEKIDLILEKIADLDKTVSPLTDGTPFQGIDILTSKQQEMIAQLDEIKEELSDEGIVNLEQLKEQINSYKGDTEKILNEIKGKTLSEEAQRLNSRLVTNELKKINTNAQAIKQTLEDTKKTLEHTKKLVEKGNLTVSISGEKNIGKKGKKGGAIPEDSALVNYIGNLSEQSLALKQEMTTIMSNYDGSSLINVKPVVEAIVKDTGITEESINKTMKFLYDCLNGIIPYETSIKILANEKIEKMLNPLLGPNWVFLKNPASFDIKIEDIEMKFGGKKRKKTIKKKYLKRNKTHKKKYFGGLGQLKIEDKITQELVIQNSNNDILVNEMPILLELYLYNFELTLEDQTDYFIEKTKQIFLSNKTVNLLNDIETIKYTEKLLEVFFSMQNYNLDETGPYIEEIIETQDAGEGPGVRIRLWNVIRSIIKDLASLFIDGDGGCLNINAIFKMIIIRLVPVIIAYYKGPGSILVTGAFVLTQEAFNLLIFLAKIVASIIMWVINWWLCQFNLDGIIENIAPFTSIYNYDYIATAIDNKEFYTDLINSEPRFKLNQTVNKNGTTNAFPEKFIENIYYPFTQKQVRTIKNYSKANLSKMFSLGDIKMSSEKNTLLLNELNNVLNKISCGIQIDKYFENNFLKEEYIKYFKKPEDETQSAVGQTALQEEAVGFLDKKKKSYITQGSYNNRWQTGGLYVSIDKLTVKKNDISSFNGKTRMPVNISGNFVDFRKDEINIAFKTEYYDIETYQGSQVVPTESINLNDIKSNYFKILRDQIRATASTIPASVQFLKDKPYNLPLYKDTEQTKFENVLELLKIIRTGVIFQGENSEISKFNQPDLEKYPQFVYHPHYALNNNESKFYDATTTKVEYYLPIIYPPTNDVMFGFCEFLNKKGYKYIWLNKFLEPFDLKEQVDFGIRFTFPIKPFNVDDNTQDKGNEPICIILSPNHKEGFSFSYNPSLISLGLSETAGDEEQIYGRVLRKYGKEALDGKYGKKIYQYFSGGNQNTTTLPILTSLYSLDNKTVFRGMYDSTGFSKTTANGSIFGSLGDNIWLSIFHGYDNLNLGTWISPSAKDFIFRQEFDKVYHDNVEEKQKFFDEQLQILDLSDELQLKLLYNVKYVCLEFFKKIATKENAIPVIDSGKRIFKPWTWLNSNTTEPDFHPIDVQEMLKSNVDPKVYCIQNLKFPNDPERLYKAKDELNISSALVCCINAPPVIANAPPAPANVPPNRNNAPQASEDDDEDALDYYYKTTGKNPNTGFGGYKKKHRVTIKKNKNNKNKNTRKHKK